MKPSFLAGLLVLLPAFFMPAFAEDPLGSGSGRFSLGDPLEDESKGDEAPFHFDQRDWNKMRRDVEAGKEPGAAPSVQTSTVTAAPPKPPPGQLYVDLPYESSLSVTGRKLITLDITNTHISKERAEELGTKQDQQTFTMEQELQARIQGTVARKTTINVNFDDTKENVKDFSVIYKGDPDEVVQEAAFGDIVLSLPSTEFVNYNKQLFGIRAALKYKRLGFMAIGSRTKGTTETKRFTGTTTRQQVFINDTAYVRRKFYDLTFTTASAMAAVFAGNVVLPLSDAMPEEVYIEDTTGLLIEASTITVSLATQPASAIQPKMRLMSRGVDYSIDRLRGIITFTNPINEDVRVAVDFTLNDGTRLTDNTPAAGDVAVLIKDKSPEGPEVSQEIRRFYSVGSRNIVRDNGLGNFILKVLDNTRENEIGDGLAPPQRYPDTIDMTFETGIFELDNPLPFPDVYASNVLASNPLHAVFSVEFQSILRTYTLRPNIVLQSEVVMVDSRKVTRDLDYFIDYDIGIITFFNDDLIRESTTIEITYEFAPFGGALGETLVGARTTFDIVNNGKIAGIAMDNWSVGSTVLYNFATKPSAPPDARSTPASLLVTEGDTNLKGVKFGKLPFNTNFAVEAARSSEDPNLFGKALIDSMEGIKQDDASPLIEEAWVVGSNPASVGGHNAVTDFRGQTAAASHLRWGDTDVDTLDPNDGSATQKALSVVYSLNTTNGTTPEQVSLVNVISAGGRDFSKKTTLEVELFGAGAQGAGVDVIIDYGTFNEDADGDGILDTEDQIPFDGVLNLGEDIGWQYDGPGDDLSVNTPPNTITRVGDSNTRLDAEDLNGDRTLTLSDTSVTIGEPLFRLSRGLIDTQGNLTTDLNFPVNQRRLFQIPLNVNSLSSEERARLTAVRQVRVTVRNENGAGTSRSSTFLISRLTVVGNTWEPAVIAGGTGVSTMTIKAINNKDDAGIYTTLNGHPDYSDLYKDATPEADAKEQALNLQYDLAPGATGTTRNAFSVPRDFARHDLFKFFLRKRNGVNTGGRFFLRAGSDTEYQQVNVDVADIPDSAGWLVVKLEQKDLNGDGTPDTWVSQTPNVTITQVGAVPNLSQVSQFVAGIVNDTGAAIANEVWVNEIHLSNPHERVGHAKRYSFDSVWNGWMDFGASYRDVDRNWQTPTTAITNQDRTQQDAFVNVNRLNFLPMTFKTAREKTLTPSAFRANQNALVSFLEEGRVERFTNNATAKLILPKFPILDFGYDDQRDENNLTQRTEVMDSWRAGATYSPITKFDLLPGGFLSFRPFPTSWTYFHSERRTRLRFPDAAKLSEFDISTAPFSSTNLTQYSKEDEVRLAFRPWDGFTFNPSYKLRTETEERFFREDEKTSLPTVNLIDGRETPRSISQSMSASGSLRLTKWLEPRYSYAFSGSETNGLPTQTNTTGYQLKNITRNSSGELSGTIQVNQLAPRLLMFNSMNINASYKLENGDTYQNMPEGFKWRDKYWAGDELDVGTGTIARRTDATDRRTFQNSVAWQPFSGYNILNLRWKPLKTMSVTSNYLRSKEESETTGTGRFVDASSFPDLILTINDTEDFFNVKRAIDNSRLVLRNNKRKTETRNISRNLTESYGVEYQFLFYKKLDISSTLNQSQSREDNLITNQLASKTDTLGYSLQTRIPWRVWAFTPRYEHNETESRDALRLTNDLKNDIYSVQIYADITKPIGLRFGRKEIGLANRLIMNSTIKWDKKRSAVNPSSNYLDIYSATLDGDYTLSQNFRLKLGGNFAQESHHPDFSKLDRTTFGVNATLTIQF